MSRMGPVEKWFIIRDSILAIHDKATTPKVKKKKKIVKKKRKVIK